MTTPTPTATGTEGRLCAMFATRQQMGIVKYGTTVHDNPLTRLQWEYHCLEELMDACVYSLRIIEIMEAQLDDGR